MQLKYILPQYGYMVTEKHESSLSSPVGEACLGQVLCCRVQILLPHPILWVQMKKTVAVCTIFTLSLSLFNCPLSKHLPQKGRLRCSKP